MKTDYRPGSMGAADEKESKTAIIIIGGIFAALLLLTLIPNHLYFHLYFIRAAWYFKTIGLILAAVWYVAVITKMKDVESGRPFAILMFFGMAIILATLFGFNLDLHGIE